MRSCSRWLCSRSSLPSAAHMGSFDSDQRWCFALPSCFDGGHCYDGRIALYLSDHSDEGPALGWTMMRMRPRTITRGVTCQACAGVHFVNRKGKVLGGDD